MHPKASMPYTTALLMLKSGGATALPTPVVVTPMCNWWETYTAYVVHKLTILSSCGHITLPCTNIIELIKVIVINTISTYSMFYVVLRSPTSRVNGPPILPVYRKPSPTYRGPHPQWHWPIRAIRTCKKPNNVCCDTVSYWVTFLNPHSQRHWLSCRLQQQSQRRTVMWRSVMSLQEVKIWPYRPIHYCTVFTCHWWIGRTYAIWYT